MSSCCSAGILDSFLASLLAFFFHVLVSFCKPCFSHVMVAKLSPRQCTSGHGISRHPHGSVIYARRFGAHSLVCVTGSGTNAGFGHPFSRHARHGGTQAKSVMLLIRTICTWSTIRAVIFIAAIWTVRVHFSLGMSYSIS